MAVEVLAICIREKIPSCIRAPPEELKTMAGMRRSYARSKRRATFSPTTEPIEPPMKSKANEPTEPVLPAISPLEMELFALGEDLHVVELELPQIAAELADERGLQVVEVDRVTVVLHLGELARQGVGGEVPGDVGEPLQLVGEAHLDQQRS